jgi:hypothetical protein
VVRSRRGCADRLGGRSGQVECMVLSSGHTPRLEIESG